MNHLNKDATLKKINTRPFKGKDKEEGAPCDLLDKTYVRNICTALFHELRPQEHLALSYRGEESLFVRMNQGKIRQATHVTQGHMDINFVTASTSTKISFPLTGTSEDVVQAQYHLRTCREICQNLPPDPYCVLPEAMGESEENYKGSFLSLENLAETLLSPFMYTDIAGLYTGGSVVRGSFNSQGTNHWFEAENFYSDYSLYTPSQQAIKSIYAGSHWHTPDYRANAEAALNQLRFVEKSPLVLPPGKYRVYFAPAAVADLVHMLSWGGVSGASLMQGSSCLKSLYDDTAHLSPLFSLKEDFTQGFVPRFNMWGQVSDQIVPLITEGAYQTPLVNQRTSQEYTLTCNGANEDETLRSPVIAPGTLRETEVLKALDTGLYISHLHYLNWSDLTHGRITGMTRYGCFWVEKGEIISPIQDLRFDETLYHFWGQGLEAFSDKAHFIPHISSYGARALGGAVVPGMLVNNFHFTL